MKPQKLFDHVKEMREERPEFFKSKDDLFSEEATLIPVKLGGKNRAGDTGIEKILAADEEYLSVDRPFASEDELALGFHPGAPSDERWGETMETLAFYLPYHVFEKYWGIYIKPEGVQRIRKHLDGFFRSEEIRAHDQIAIATHLLYYHEFYHNSVEGFATRLEAMTRKPAYIKHISERYKQTFGSAKCLEETCANSYAREKLLHKSFDSVVKVKDKKAFRKALNDLFSRQPGGYKQAASTKQTWDEKTRIELLEDYVDTLAPPQSRNSSVQGIFALWKGSRIDQSVVSDVIRERVFYYVGKTSTYLGDLRGYKYTNVKKMKFIKHLVRKYGVQEQHGGKHSKLVIPPKQIKIPYTTKRDNVEEYLAGLVAEALGISERELMDF